MNFFSARGWGVGVLWLAATLGLVGAPRTQKTPFRFEPLGIDNPCFIDSVRFADTYLGGREGKGSRWVRVLRWGTVTEDYSAGPGHAVAIFQWRGSLFVFDINHGVRKLDVPVAQRTDLRALSDAVFSLYPKIKPTGAALLDDSWTTRRPALMGADDGPVTPAYRDAYRAAQTVAKQREVRLIRFSYVRKGVRQESAAAVFLFDRKLCVYVPEKGTVVQKQVLPAIDDDELIRARLVRCFGPDAAVQVAPALAREAVSPRQN